VKRTLIILVIVLLFLAGWFGRGAIRDWRDSFRMKDIPEPQPAGAIENVNGTNENRNTIPPESTASMTNATEEVNANATAPLPREKNLAVPFTSQAPHANWDLPYQEACEEAAALMVHRFWEGKSFASKQDADAAIRAIVDFEEKTYGFYKDTTAEETARFIRDLWGYKNVSVVTGASVTIEHIKQEVALGYPVIVLAAGRELGNTNFRRPGPIYHALVIKGYTKKGMIITNDPGTRKGADYLYDPDVLLAAIHDWNGGDVANGERNMIVIRQ
jgi:hypothetical protein